MLIEEVEIGHKFNTPSRGEGKVISRTKRTITAKFSKSTCKITYNHNGAEFEPCDF